MKIIANIRKRGDYLKHLKTLREKNHLSQQKLASIINVSQQSIYKYENGLAEPDFKTLIDLADYFETSVDYLIGNTNICRKYEHLNDEKLSDIELEMIKEFRKLPTDLKDILIIYAKKYNTKK